MTNKAWSVNLVFNRGNYSASVAFNVETDEEEVGGVIRLAKKEVVDRLLAMGIDVLPLVNMDNPMDVAHSPVKDLVSLYYSEGWANLIDFDVVVVNSRAYYEG